MNPEAETILKVIEQYLIANPKVRFCQALFNLNITQFADQGMPENKDHLLRDLYNDTDTEVLERMSEATSKMS